MRRDRPPRAVLAAWLVGLAAATPAQAPAGHQPPAAPAGETHRGAAGSPTHASQLTLPPWAAYQHVRAGNQAYASARAAQAAPPAPAARPTGAGRYVCAAVVCADADLDVAALLGLRRQDVLVLAAPGPLVAPETAALLEQAVAEERLPLIVVIGHADCRTLATRPGVTPGQDALARRIAAIRHEAERTATPLPRSLVQAQCQRLLAASDVLRAHHARDALRLLPAVVDDRTGALTWHHPRSEEFALRPVR
jgi:carbonic anhydrase